MARVSTHATIKKRKLNGSRLGSIKEESLTRRSKAVPGDSEQIFANAWRRFQSATMALVHEGPIKNRLAQAFLRHLHDMQQDEVPEIIREDFARLCAMLTSKPPIVAGEHSVRATLRKMSRAEADRCAEQIVRIYDTLVRYGHSA